jgi:hypothetical protein
MEVEGTRRERGGSGGYGGRRVEVEDTGRNSNGGYREGERAKHRRGYREGQGGMRRIQEGRVRNMVDTGRERDGSGGYMEGEGWK